MMRLIDGMTEFDYLKSLNFEIANQTEVALISLMPITNAV